MDTIIMPSSQTHGNGMNNNMSFKRKKILFFTDFDGTITTQDTGTVIIDASMGYERRRELDLEIFHARRSFRDAVHEMWSSVSMEWEDAVSLLHSVKLDPGFDDLFHYLQQQNIPMTVLSSGLTRLVERYLSTYVKQSNGKLKILANDVEICDKTKQWQIVYRDETPFGHDKGEALREAKREYNNGTQHHHSNGDDELFLVFVGDGVSDLSAAKEAHLIFAKRGKDLSRWCQNEKLENVIEWDDLSTVKETIQSLLSSSSSSSSS